MISLADRKLHTNLAMTMVGIEGGFYISLPIMEEYLDKDIRELRYK